MNDELKSCPFCGEDAVMERRTAILNGKYDELNSYVLICCSNEDSCGAAIAVNATHDSIDQELLIESKKAVELWNRRT